MVVHMLLAPKNSIAFPELEVSNALRDDLIKRVRDDAVRLELDLPDSDDKLVTTLLELDSLSAVESLCSLDGILPFKVGQCAVQAGGYNSIGAALDDMLPRIKKQWEKRVGGNK